MIFLDTNVVSEVMRKSPNPAVVAWLTRFDGELALPTIAIAEIAFGIERIRPEQRSPRHRRDLDEMRRRYADRIYGFTEPAALAYGALMGGRARAGRPMAIPDAMIAAIAKVNGGELATRNLADFDGLGLKLICPWDF